MSSTNKMWIMGFIFISIMALLSNFGYAIDNKGYGYSTNSNNYLFWDRFTDADGNLDGHVSNTGTAWSDRGAGSYSQIATNNFYMPVSHTYWRGCINVSPIIDDASGYTNYTIDLYVNYTNDVGTPTPYIMYVSYSPTADCADAMSDRLGILWRHGSDMFTNNYDDMNVVVSAPKINQNYLAKLHIDFSNDFINTSIYENTDDTLVEVGARYEAIRGSGTIGSILVQADWGGDELTGGWIGEIASYEGIYRPMDDVYTSPIINITFPLNNSITSEYDPLSFIFSASDNGGSDLFCNLTIANSVPVQTASTQISANFTYNSTSSRNIINTSGLYQTFTSLKGGMLQNISVLIATTGIPTSDTYMYLFNVTSGYPDKVVANLSSIPIGYVNPSYKWYNVSSNINIVPNKEYAIVMLSNNKLGNATKWNVNTTANYADGHSGIAYSLTSFSTIPAEDNPFIVYVLNSSIVMMNGNEVIDSGFFPQNEYSTLNFTSPINFNDNFTILCINPSTQLQSDIFINVTIDAENPFLYVLSPINNSIFNTHNDALNITSLCYDINIMSNNYTLYNSSWSVSSSSTASGNTSYLSNKINISSYGIGYYSIDYLCSDVASNTAHSNMNVYITDIISPNPHLVFPKNNTNFSSSGTEYIMQFKYNDTTSANCTLYINNIANTTILSYSGNNYINSTLNTNGTYFWYVNCVNDIASVTSETNTFLFRITTSITEAVYNPFTIGSCPLTSIFGILLWGFLFGIAFVIMGFAYWFKHGLVGAFGGMILMFDSFYIFGCVPAIALLIMCGAMLLMFYFISKGVMGEL
jgi:hypothetical protein